MDLDDAQLTTSMSGYTRRACHGVVFSNYAST